jgi:hypothetical protein
MCSPLLDVFGCVPGIHDDCRKIVYLKVIQWPSSNYADGDRIERHGLSADEKGRKLLVPLLRETGVAGYEVCRFGNRLARILQQEMDCTVIALNPGDLRIIWKRRACGPGKKTDREDALKMR